MNREKNSGILIINKMDIIIRNRQEELELSNSLTEAGSAPSAKTIISKEEGNAIGARNLKRTKTFKVSLCIF